ncbi:MAG: beta-ketoacyl synthase N-terminal-like domain-containing protein [Spirulina sp.]
MQYAVADGGFLPSDPNAPTTLPEALERAAFYTPTKGLIAIQSDGSELSQSYKDLLEEAQHIMAGLRKLGLKPQDKVIFQLDLNRDFIAAFWGCILGGFVPVPLSISPSYEETNSIINKLLNAWQMLEKPIILTSVRLASAVDSLSQHFNLKDWQVGAIEDLRSNKPDLNYHPSEPDDLALLVLTSGSTGMPKAVMLSHRNILSCIEGIKIRHRYTATDISFNWLPVDHVGSLLMFHVRDIYLCCQQIHAPIEYILSNPVKWIDLLDYYRVTVTWAPNFAYSLVNAKAEIVNQGNWDLSSVRYIINGAEAIVDKTARDFMALLSPHKLSKNAMQPAWGMSETSSGVVFCDRYTWEGDREDTSFVNLGNPIAGVSLRVVDDRDRVVAEGTIGRLQVKGLTVTKGYYNNPQQNKEAFTTDGWFNTGDLGFIKNGEMTITGRAKDVIIVNGVNYYCHEIEAVVEEVEGVNVSYTAACGVKKETEVTEQLAIFFNCNLVIDLPILDLLKTIRDRVISYCGINPDYLIPVEKNALPKTSIGKIQRSHLTQRFQDGEFEQIVSKIETLFRSRFSIDAGEFKKQLIEIWQESLKQNTVGTQDNFFELGGTSLSLLQVQQKIGEKLGYNLGITDFFRYPTINSLVNYLTPQENTKVIPRKTRKIKHQAVAIIGMAGRFPGAKNLTEFWHNLTLGKESIAFFSEAELLASGVDSNLVKNPNYVKASPILDDIEKFDADFFSYRAKEAELLDPQQRLLLECAWESLEDAGYDPLTYDGAIALYAGAVMDTYLLNNIYPNRHKLDPNDTLNPITIDSFGGFQMMVANDKDYLTSRISYKLNLTGPSINVQTACSTSLAAVHLAIQSLLDGSSDLAMAGGVSVQVPQTIGHLYQEGMILSPDSHCRAFDARAQGTIFGSGVGLVVLKPLEMALQDRDYIYAVIKGSAISNDGGSKVNYFAPNGEGQTRAAAEAIARAEIDANSISYVETHGTGTFLGDPIEIDGLTQAFRLSTQKRQFCAIGSVKTNIGHLQIASGIVGLIKTVLALHHGKIPPSLHFNEPNPQINFADSPFYVNTQLQDWEVKDYPRRAGVNSLGIGGTNVHVVLEEWNQEERQQGTGNGEQGKQLLLLSAKTATALETATVNLANHLNSHPELELADVAYTLTVGRKTFAHRRIAVVPNLEDAANTLRDNQKILTNSGKVKTRSVAFMFSGQGSQYVNMTRELYETQTTFTEQVDKCCALLQSHLGFDLRDIFYPSEGQTETATEKLKQTAITQPALFVIEYALAQLWMSWGIKPAALIGHSIGEYVAATLAGVFRLKDALALVTARGKLMQSMPTGSMLAVPLPAEEVKTLIAETSLEIATINSSENCVVSGTTADIEAFEKELASKEIEGRRLHASHAFHSSMMEGMLEPFSEKVKQVKLNPPTIPFISNLTGTWITAEQATNPSYYAQHLRSCVRFADGVKQLFNDPNQILLEVGPGRTLSTLAKRHPEKPTEQIILTSVRHPKEEGSDVSFLLKALGQLWLAGTEIDWIRYYGEEKHYRVPLPTYPFERKRYWIDPPKQQPIYDRVNYQQLWQSAVEAGLVQAQEGIAQFEKPEVEGVATGKETLAKKPDISVELSEQSELELSSTYEAPRTEIEQAIANIWEQVLGINPIGIHDDFFELGGDSLIAVQLIGKLRSKLERDLSTKNLFNAPTIAELAEGIEPTTSLKNATLELALPSCVVKLKTGSSQKKPLFLVHPAEGQVNEFRKLSHLLDPQQPVYGLQAPGLEEETSLHSSTVEEIASHYLEAIRVIQLNGPYFLGGHSFGGYVALEMAQQLINQNEKVPLLAIFDCPWEENGSNPFQTNEDVLTFLFSLAVDEEASIETFRKLKGDEQLLYFLSSYKDSREKQQDVTDFELNYLRNMVEIFKNHASLLFQYSPKHYPGEILYFHAQKGMGLLSSKSPTNRWFELALEGINIFKVPGNHATMFNEPNVQVLAQKLQKCLESAA